MPFDNIISRSDAQSLIPEDAAVEIITSATQESAALTVLRRAPMGSKISRMPVLSVAPAAYWVNGDTGLKQTSDAAWVGVELVAEELAVIVPCPEAVLDDADYPIWESLRPVIAERFGHKLDQAVFGGIDKPATWGTAIIPGAIAAGNVEAGGAAAAEGGIGEDLNQTMALVEEDGFDVTALVAKRALRTRLRGARDATGQRLTEPGAANYEGVPISYALAGAFPADALAVAGDFSLGIIGIRQDLTFKLLDQSVITDDTGKVILNLAQQDSIAMRVVGRFAYATAIPATLRETGATGQTYPFAVLEQTTL